MILFLLLHAFVARKVGAADVSKYDPIAGHQPHSLVTDIAAIDEDLDAMRELFAQNEEGAFEQAHRFYTEGANSLSVASLSLDDELQMTLLEGTEVVGESENGNAIFGTVYADAYPGDFLVLFQYQVGGEESCRVGARLVDEQELSGCLQSQGILTTLLGSIAYRYDPFVENTNGRTLQSLSLDAKQLMSDCPSCPSDEFLKFQTYYGVSSYADAWVSAAFQGEATNLVKGRNVDFSHLSLVARGEAIMEGVNSLTVWMYVIRLMESSLDSCESGCANCSEKAAHVWDQAVALYAGSLEGPEGSSDGLFSYALADKRCADFRTCGRGTDHNEGTSAVNYEVINLFGLGQIDVFNGACDMARDHKDRIVDLMTVPLVQSTLKYTYMRERQESSETEEAIATVFAASIVPIIHDCNEEDAALIWKQTAIGSSIQPDFLAVKAAFERNYDCLRITCTNVGGLYDTASLNYFPDAGPCGRTAGKSSKSSESLSGRIAFFAAAFLGSTALFMSCVLTRKCAGKDGRPPTDAATVDMDLEEDSNWDLASVSENPR